MAIDLDPCGIIEHGAAQSPIVEDKAERLDQIDRDPKARGKPQQGAGILRNIGLEQGQPQIARPGQVAQSPAAL